MEEAFHPRDAIDDLGSRILEDHPLDCQACRDLSEESGLPMHCLGLPYTKPSSRPNSSEMANEAIGINDEPTSDPTHSRYYASLLLSTKTARCFGYVTSIPSKICHLWLGSLLGLGSLTLAIVSLLMYTIRSYRMAIWTTRNDELQACTGLIQVRDSRSSDCCSLMQYQAERPVGPNCERLISEGPQDPPYNLSRRMTSSGGPGSFFNLSDISVVGNDLLLPVERKYPAWLIFALIFALISLADLLLNSLRQRSRTEDDFESLVVTRMPTLPYHGFRSKIMGDEHADAWFTGAHIDPLMGIRRRFGLRQEVQDETSIENESEGEEGLSYSMARYLKQPLNTELSERSKYFPWKTLE